MSSQISRSAQSQELKSAQHILLRTFGVYIKTNHNPTSIHRIAVLIQHDRIAEAELLEAGQLRGCVADDEIDQLVRIEILLRKLLMARFGRLGNDTLLLLHVIERQVVCRDLPEQARERAQRFETPRMRLRQRTRRNDVL